MTISEQTPSNSYIGDGANDTFAFTFRILQNSDLIVTVDGAPQTESTDYTIQNQLEDSGDVVFEAGSIPEQNAVVNLIRNTSEDQNTVYTPFDPFPAKSHEAALDKLTMLIQELANVSGSSNIGLPLDPTQQFWDAVSLQIKNLPNPSLDTDAANKGYVDGQVGSPFDPSADETITGLWNFTQVITGQTTGNLIAESLDPYGQLDLNETVLGTWRFFDGGGSARKVAARNPRERILLINTVPTQADEGIILRVGAVITSIILDPLEAQTVFSIFAKESGYALGEGTGVTINHYDGQGNIPPTGDRTIARGSVIDVVYESQTEVSIYGNGIS